jgi:ribosome-associated translation inhibitor RaiA
MEPSPAVAARVDAEVQKLRRYFDRIGHCHVVIIAPVQHHTDRQYAVHLEIAVPRRVLAIRQEPAGAATRPAGKHTGRAGAHRDIYVVIRTVFDTARRQLEEYVRRSRAPV